MQTNTSPALPASPILSTFELVTLSLPAIWLSAVLYGDKAGLLPEEADAFDRWLADTKDDLGHGKPILIAKVDTNSYFCRIHDATDYGMLPCMCVDVDLLVEA